jgi:mannobiose 2-epimerase
MTDKAYKERAEKVLKENILPFWITHVAHESNEGFYGHITNDLIKDEKAPLSLVLCSRILWTYSMAYRVYREPSYLQMAQRAYTYLNRYFWDSEFGGLYWQVSSGGEVLIDRKQIYGQAFGIYAYTEYYSATKQKDSLEKAIKLFQLIEAHSYDEKYKGYTEAFTRQWKVPEDVRMSNVAMNEKKSMNNHLHVMEAYTNLLLGWKDESLQLKLKELIEITLDHIIDQKTAHFQLFFDEQWNVKCDHVSYGHDIEGSWLLVEAAEVLGDKAFIEKTKAMAIEMAQVTFDEGRDKDGSLFYEANPQEIFDKDKDWWPQAEAAVGFLNAYQLTGKPQFLQAFKEVWDFIEKKVIDWEHGEWFNKIKSDGEIAENMPKVGPWKCPYHNSRACFEIMKRLA